MTPLVTENKTAQAFTVLERAVCVTLHCSSLGNHRKVELDALVKSVKGDGDTAPADGAPTLDESAFHATKRLLDPKVLRPALRVLDKAKALLRGMSIPTHRVFGDRSYLVPLVLVDEVEAMLLKLRDELEVEVAILCAKLQEAIAEQRVKLGAHFREADYRTEAEVRTAFALDWAYVSFSAPDRLETVSMALAQKAQAQYESRLSACYDEAVLAVRQQALHVMSDLSRRLGRDADGKARTLRGTAFDDFAEFCRRLPALNSIAGDDDLADVMKQVQAKLDGVDVEALRDSDTLRDALAAVAQDVTATLEGMVVSTRGRSIAFDEM